MLHFVPRKHVEKMEEYCVSMFGSNPKLTVMPPLDEGDPPELETSKFLDQDGIRKH